MSMWHTGGCARHTRPGLQEECGSPPEAWPAQRCGVAGDAVRTDPLDQGARGTQSVGRKATRWSVAHPVGTHGRCLTQDVTSPDTFATSHLHATSLQAGAAAQKAETTKTAKYATIALMHVLLPLAFENLGA